MYVAGEVRPVLSRVKIHPRHSRGGVGLSDGVRGGRGPRVLTGRRGLSGGRKPQHCLGDGERRMARAPPPHRPRSGETLLTCPPGLGCVMAHAGRGGPPLVPTGGGEVDPPAPALAAAGTLQPCCGYLRTSRGVPALS